jgi:DNA-binding transcriptional ArsR family regulator
MMLALPVVDKGGNRTLSGTEFVYLMADPTRRHIILRLMHGEARNSEIAEVFNLPRNLVSYHLRLLRESGLIRERRDPHDQRSVYLSIDRTAYSRAYDELVRLLDPAQIEDRAAEPPGSIRRLRLDH